MEEQEKDVRDLAPYDQIVAFDSEWGRLRAPALVALALFTLAGIAALGYWGQPLLAAFLGLTGLALVVLLRPP